MKSNAVSLRQIAVCHTDTPDAHVAKNRKDMITTIKVFAPYLEGLLGIEASIPSKPSRYGANTLIVVIISLRFFATCASGVSVWHTAIWRSETALDFIGLASHKSPDSAQQGISHPRTVIKNGVQEAMSRK